MEENEKTHFDNDLLQRENLERLGCKFLEEGIDYPKQTGECDSDQCDDEITLAARKSFGISYLYPWQRIVISNILEGAAFRKNPDTEPDAENSDPVLDTTDSYLSGRQIVLLPTGAGKSLCFLTPALLLDGPTMVLYPLLALMADQKRRMDEGGIKSVIFRGGQTKEEREENFTQIRNGARIILANPEVLQNRDLLEKLAQCGIAHIAIDEAHCVSEWGDTFRPAYLTLGDVIQKINPPVVTAFTATASPQVLARISQVLFQGQAHIVRSDSDRPNIHYYVVNSYAKKRMAFKLAIDLPKPLLIFCGTREKAMDMARDLRAYYGPDKVCYYHAGLEKAEKTKIENWLFNKKDAIACCTCALGMGWDKKDIHNVIHLEPSPTGEAYIQEAGRGGRDGSVANAWLLWNHDDDVNSSRLPEGDRGKTLSVFANSTTCRRQILLDALGGEEAYCEGCDVCMRKGPAPFAQDAAFALKLINRHNREFTSDQLEQYLLEEFNRKDHLKYGMNIWESSDISEILRQLKDSGYIKKDRLLWKNRICIPFSKTACLPKLKDENSVMGYYSSFSDSSS